MMNRRDLLAFGLDLGTSLNDRGRRVVVTYRVIASLEDGSIELQIRRDTFGEEASAADSTEVLISKPFGYRTLKPMQLTITVCRDPAVLRSDLYR